MDHKRRQIDHERQPRDSGDAQCELPAGVIAGKLKYGGQPQRRQHHRHQDRANRPQATLPQTFHRGIPPEFMPFYVRRLDHFAAYDEAPDRKLSTGKSNEEMSLAPSFSAC
jgi:hypothetical protein